MDISLLLKAAIMGVVEGLTEFIPVSSTGHLILVGELINFPKAIAPTFEIFIQLGAILAVVVYFLRDLAGLLRRALNGEGHARRLIVGVAIAFVPAAVVGVVLGSWIKRTLFNPFAVAFAMLVGGVALLAVEQFIARRPPKTAELEAMSAKQALGVGLAQIFALWPGASRSASTIVGGLLVGLDRVTAVRFSFYLAIPTMLAATLYDLARNIKDIHAEDVAAFAVGISVAFVVALVVIRFFLRYVSHGTLRPFGWYRIIVGGIVLAYFGLAQP